MRAALSQCRPRDTRIDGLVYAARRISLAASQCGIERARIRAIELDIPSRPAQDARPRRAAVGGPENASQTQRPSPYRSEYNLAVRGMYRDVENLGAAVEEVRRPHRAG